MPSSTQALITFSVPERGDGECCVRDKKLKQHTGEGGRRGSGEQTEGEFMKNVSDVFSHLKEMCSLQRGGN